MKSSKSKWYQFGYQLRKQKEPQHLSYHNSTIPVHKMLRIRRVPYCSNPRPLREICIAFVVEGLRWLLTRRKAAMAKTWLLEHREWSLALRLGETAAALAEELPCLLLQEVLLRGMEATAEGRHRDLQTCFFEMMVAAGREEDGTWKRGAGVRKVVLPYTLRRDGSSRAFCLRTLAGMESNELATLDLKCYANRKFGYIGDKEKELLISVIQSSRHLVHLGLRNVSLSAVDSNKYVVLQAVADACSSLRILDCRGKEPCCSGALDALQGKSKYVRKSKDLWVWQRLTQPRCVFRETLEVLDLAGWRVSSANADVLKEFFPKLTTFRYH